MKKIALISLITLSFLKPFKAQSQTKEQTVNWIMNQVGKLAFSQYMPYFNLKEMNNGAVILCYPDYVSVYTIQNVRFVNFSQITGINYKAEEGKYFMTLTGDFGEARKKDSNVSTWAVDDKNYLADYYVEPNRYKQLMITYAVTEDDFKRIKKAYEHLAKLCGANLVSDDLFKN